jgi:Uma2 family endonuclease
MVVQEKLYTAADLEKLAESDNRYELVEGVLIEMPPPKREHGLVAASLNAFIFTYVRANDLGQVTTESGFHLFESPDTVRAPEIAFIAKGHILPLSEGYDKMAPDLAVEIASPGNSASDLNEKIVQYFQAGVRQVWVAYPKTRMIHVYRSIKEVVVLDTNDTLDGGDVLPGLKLAVRDVFAPLGN